jgi:hypothetical protein
MDNNDEKEDLTSRKRRKCGLLLVNENAFAFSLFSPTKKVNDPRFSFATG